MTSSGPAVRPWVPLALTALTALTFLLVYHYFILCAGGGCVPDRAFHAALEAVARSDAAAQRAALPYRLVWVCLVGLSVLVPILCTAVAATCLWPLDRKRRTPRLIIALVLTVGFTLLFFSAHSSTPDHVWRQFLHEGLLADFPAILWLNPRLDAVSLFTTLAIACAVTGLIAEATDSVTPPTLADVVRHRRWMNGILYLAAAELVVSLVRLRVFMDWSLAYVLPLPEGTTGELAVAQAALPPVAGAVTTVLAILYTAFLLGISLPTAMVIRGAGDAMSAEQPTDSRERVQWEAMVSLSAQAPRLLAILAPLLSGLIAELVKVGG
ncbi:MAG: hypothetical protein IPK12_19700 [Gemmatimonadetes bacterium]|nr:hypothetical protein [Gemmatimonadota bacterium]